IPERMYASVIRPERYGEPTDAFQIEQIAIPEVGPRDALVLVMAAGINYNNVWAARGLPVDVTKVHGKLGEPDDFHIGGSDASGVVYAVGDEVTNVKVGDHVVIHCGQWDPEADSVRDPMYHPSFRIWGYESNWGSFAQFTKVQSHQCMPKAPQLTWEQAAAPTLVGATAYRMLFGWSPNVVEEGDVVLVWGGAGGLGSMAIQLVKDAGGRAVAVVSDESKVEFCTKLGAVGVIDRREFDHWGMLPHWQEEDAFAGWTKGAKAFGKAIWDAVGEKISPKIVFEHPGESTIPTSMFVCDTGGMVVICAGTTGYNATVDLRYLWMRQKRLQGSHFANDEQSLAFNQLVVDGRIDPCLSRTFSFEDIGTAHQLMAENRHPEGNMAALVSAPREGLTDLP
ncbi:MAG TPA: crotonyl-CoA carboxylase/reductase, partial [Actinomycetota bacterium]|nr:crotonyl-CoA carboxylase/reductase [Actinomycetota bacterium]